jgi:hypothetical protein
MARGGRRRKARGLNAYSEEQLAMALAKRRELRLRELKKERAKLDAEIAAIEGAGAARKIARGRKPKAAAAAKGKRTRSSRAEVKAMNDRVQKAVAAAGKNGINMADLRKMVRGSTIQLRAALKKLMAGKKVKKTGDRRQTKYFAA